MPPKRRPKQHDKSATNASKNNGAGARASPNRSLDEQRSPSSSGLSKSLPSWRRPKNVSSSDYKSRIETLWKNMGNGRVTERQNAIKNGLMADPNKRTTLANAIRVVGTCQDMCPEYERVQRIRENAVDRAEKVALHGGAKVTDESKMVKAFHRPDAGKEEQLPSDLRSPAVLQTTVRYLLDHVASPASSLAEHHKFVWDRTRCIRNDFTIQASRRLEDIKIAIQCYEEIARFHILSLHQMPKIGKHDYDPQQELEQLSATLLTLFEYYDDNRGTYEAPHEAEFRTYKLLIDIRSRTNDTLERVQTWPPRVRDSVQVQTAVLLCQASGSVYTDTASMLSPYARSVQVESAQYARFWSILDSSQVDYLMACAASVSFNEIRARALETMAKVYRSAAPSRLQDLSLDELTFSLGLDSDSQTRSLLKKSGLSISKDASGISYLDLNELSGPFPKASVASVEQMFSRSVVEVKREDRTFSAVYNGFNTSYCKENGLVDESEGDAEFEPHAEDVDSEDQEEESLFVDGSGEDEEMEEASAKSTKITSNPFASTASSDTGLQPASSHSQKLPPVFSIGRFGQPSTPQISTQTSSKLGSPFTATSSTQPAISTNPFSQIGTTSTTFSNMNTGGGLFGQPSAFTSTAAESVKPSTLLSFGGDSAVNSNANNGPTFFPKPTSEGPSAGLFSWKPPATSPPNPLDQASSRNLSSLSGLSDQTAEQIERSSVNTEPGNTAQPKKPLFPFVFPSPAITNVENTTASVADTTLQLPAPISIFNPKLPASEPASASTNAPAPLFSIVEPSQPSHLQALPQFTPTQVVSNTASSIDRVFTETPTNSSVSLGKPLGSSHPTTSADSNSYLIALQSTPAPNVDKNTTSVVPTPKVITTEQKRAALNVIAKDLFLGQYGILEQFIEAHLGPIYDKVQRKVTKEMTRARLDEIKQSLLGSKYFFLWRWRVDKRLQRKRAIQRRERMRQSRYDDVTTMPAQYETNGLSYKEDAGQQIDGQLKHLTRGFHETFDRSISGQVGTSQRERSASELNSREGRMSNLHSTAPARTTEGYQQITKHIRHSHSQSMDGSSRISSVRAISSMPPPHRASRSGLLARGKTSQLKPFIGTGFLQDEALRREAINLARRTGPMTTTESDYFRLKARNIDPDTGLVPLNRKRGRDPEEGGHDRSLSKSRRLSTSTVSSLAVSVGPQQVNGTTKSIEIEPPLINDQSQASTPRYTDEEDALFAAARKLRETLAEDTQWMRTMREEHEKEETNLKVETPAQRKLREFKMTPSKTSIRLRQTHANGLLPPDHFDKQLTERNKLKNTATTATNLPLDSPTPKMGLAALPRDRSRRQLDIDDAEMLAKRGTSVDDAIEL